eukprot:NODE_92_length_21543_cov_0.719036.p13 type:complete len:187 gc:universal NODE_92_length_21543_cov_0.719036:10056-10616(+)
MKKVCVLVSGNGSNLQALINCADKNYEIIQVISNNSSAKALERAETAGIAHTVVNYVNGEPRADYDKKLLSAMNSSVELVVCAGFLRILSSIILDNVTVINIHPALRNEYIGLNAIEKAFSDFKLFKKNHSGVMVHYVSEVVDRGKLIAEQVVPIYPFDTLEILKARIHKAEHLLICKAVKQVVEY